MRTKEVLWGIRLRWWDLLDDCRWRWTSHCWSLLQGTHAGRYPLHGWLLVQLGKMLPYQSLVRRRDMRRGKAGCGVSDGRLWAQVLGRLWPQVLFGVTSQAKYTSQFISLVPRCMECTVLLNFNNKDLLLLAVFFHSTLTWNGERMKMVVTLMETDESHSKPVQNAFWTSPCCPVASHHLHRIIFQCWVVELYKSNAHIQIAEKDCLLQYSYSNTAEVDCFQWWNWTQIYLATKKSWLFFLLWMHPVFGNGLKSKIWGKEKQDAY